MRQKDILKRQIEDIMRSARPYEQSLLQAEMGLASVKNRLEEAQAMTRIAEHWLRLHPPIMEDSRLARIEPIPPPHQPTMPQLHDEPEGPLPSSSQSTSNKKKNQDPQLKRNKGGKLCFRCQGDDHLSFNCPRKKKYCWHCHSDGHFPNDCIYTSVVRYQWCDKCLQMGAHSEVDCLSMSNARSVQARPLPLPSHPHSRVQGP